MKKFFFSDECHFFVKGKQSRHVKISYGEKLSPCHFNQVVKHPLKKMLWGCCSFCGVGSLVPVDGMMNSDRLYEHDCSCITFL